MEIWKLCVNISTENEISYPFFQIVKTWNGKYWCIFYEFEHGKEVTREEVLRFIARHGENSNHIKKSTFARLFREFRRTRNGTTKSVTLHKDEMRMIKSLAKIAAKYGSAGNLFLHLSQMVRKRELSAKDVSRITDVRVKSKLFRKFASDGCIDKVRFVKMLSYAYR